MNETIQSTTKEVIKQYNANGFGNGASGYLIILLAACTIGLTVIYIIKSMRNRDIEKQSSNNLQNELLKMFQSTSTKQYEEMYKMNEQIIDEIKEISQKVQIGIDKMVETNLNTTKIMYDMIESSAEETILKINSKKELGDKEYEEHIKLLFEISMLKLYRSLSDRIEKNSLSKYKNTICGTEACNFEDGEIYSELSKAHILFKEKNDLLESEYNNEKRKAKILDFIKQKIYELNIPLCRLFCVNEGYDKQETHESYKKDMKKSLSLYIDKTLNSVLETDLQSI